jgi:hypothetical protein
MVNKLNKTNNYLLHLNIKKTFTYNCIVPIKGISKKKGEILKG